MTCICFGCSALLPRFIYHSLATSKNTLTCFSYNKIEINNSLEVFVQISKTSFWFCSNLGLRPLSLPNPTSVFDICTNTSNSLFISIIKPDGFVPRVPELMFRGHGWLTWLNLMFIHCSCLVSPLRGCWRTWMLVPVAGRKMADRLSPSVIQCAYFSILTLWWVTASIYQFQYIYFQKNYKYIIYTKLNNEEETSIKAQGRWRNVMHNVNSITFERLNLCQVNSITVIDIVIYLYSTHIAVLALLYLLRTFYYYFTLIHYLLLKCMTISIEIILKGL